MSADFFMLWNIIGSVIFIVLILLHLILKNAKQEEQEREELEKRRKARFEEKEAREKKELQELLLGLSINESKEVKELMRNSKPYRLVYDNYMLGIYMFEIYDYDTCESFYVIYDWNYDAYYHNWYAYTSNDDSNIIKVVEYHRNLREKRGFKWLLFFFLSLLISYT